jgi:hypothetical protein
LSEVDEIASPTDLASASAIEKKVCMVIYTKLYTLTDNIDNMYLIDRG